MKKFIIAKTGEEVNIGDFVRETSESKNSFGTIKTVRTTMITMSNIDDFINKGIIKVVETEDLNKDNLHGSKKYLEDNVGYYLEQLASKMHYCTSELIYLLNKMNEVSPKAVLDLLLETVSTSFYEEDPQAFDSAEVYYSLRPKDGKVGKVVNINSHIPLFKSVEDAEKARTILKEQLELMYGE